MVLTRVFNWQVRAVSAQHVGEREICTIRHQTTLLCSVVWSTRILWKHMHTVTFRQHS